jgi:fructan beta-fructosidase
MASKLIKMNFIKLRGIIFVASLFFAACKTAKLPVSKSFAYNEPHRPQIHFSPPAHWMNDPNGMIFFNNLYHLFYQYYPDSTVWGPMHWGHAISEDLVHWKPLPIALYPDSIGYIFSGSTVVDINNTAGFSKNGKTALVAIFTSHDPKGEKAGTNIFQNQSLAYSLDDGKTWIKYANNPVVRNPGIRDFRDPKVSWYEPGQKWIMTLATLDRITFFSSKDLKNWKKESEFGDTFGAHGGVWECPDLFPLDYKGQKVWVLLASINPGAPNKGSGTQYFTGQFDGNKFAPYQTDTRWIDYGPDNYAGVTWSNTGSRKIFLGWMSNWQYATKVPTEKWRSAMTVPRDLGIEKIGDKFMVTSNPINELNILNEHPTVFENINSGNNNLGTKIGKITGPLKLHITSDKIESFYFTLSNDAGEKIDVGYDKAIDSYFIDRSLSGKISFAEKFAERHTAPRISKINSLDFSLIIDNSSIELFADQGLSVMTSIFFPSENYSQIQLKAMNDYIIKSIEYNRMKSVWR